MTTVYRGWSDPGARRTAVLSLLALAALLLSAGHAAAHNVTEGDAGYIQEIWGVNLIPFLYLGAKHMVTGYDHILFLLGVVFFLYKMKDVGIYVSLFALGHPACPGCVFDALRRAGTEFALTFNEIDAAQLVFDRQAPSEEQGEEGWLRRCLAVVKMMEIARLNKTLNGEAIGALKETGRLPGSDGNAVPWKLIKRAKRAPPPIPGVAAPRLLHRALLATSIFRNGPGAVAHFNNDRYLSNLNFAPVGASGRASFFAWLRKSHADLRPKALAAIGR